MDESHEKTVKKLLEELKEKNCVPEKDVKEIEENKRTQ